MMKHNLSLALGAVILLSACGGPEQPQSEEAAEAAAAVATCPQPDGDGNVQIQDGLVAKIITTGYGRSAVSKD